MIFNFKTVRVLTGSDVCPLGQRIVHYVFCVTSVSASRTLLNQLFGLSNNEILIMFCVSCQCCQLLDHIGVPYVQAAGEAEAMCALLNAAGVSIGDNGAHT